MRHAELDPNYLDESDFDRPTKKSGLKMTQICAEHLKKIILDMILYFVLLH